MALTADQLALIKRFDDVTNEISAYQSTLLAQIADGGLTPELKAAFEGTLTRLRGLGANPNNPVPA